MKYDKHIVWLTPGFAANEADLNCIPPLQILLRQLMTEDQKVKISVIAFQYPFTNEPYQWHGVDIYPANGRNRALPGKLVTWQRCKSLFKLIHSKQKIDVINSFWMNECAYIGQKIAEKYQLPHIVSLMGQDALPSNNYLRLLKKGTFKTLALSQQHALHFKETTGHEVSESVTIGISRNDFPAFNKGERPIDVLAVGSLIKVKNYPKFIEVIKRVKVTKPAIKVVVLGDGNEREKISALIEAEKLTKNIVLKGELIRKEALEIMSKSKVLLHTSNYESMGYVFLEALMSGCHLLSHRVGLASESAQWTICDKVEDFAKSMSKALKNKHERNEELILFIEDTAKRYLELYDEAVI